MNKTQKTILAVLADTLPVAALVAFAVLAAGCATVPNDMAAIKRSVDASAEYCPEVGQVWQPLDAPCHDCEEFAMKYYRELKAAGYSPNIQMCKVDSQWHMVVEANGYWFDNRLNYVSNKKECK